jgi:trk system potassium uptake protein TrkH
MSSGWIHGPTAGIWLVLAAMPFVLACAGTEGEMPPSWRLLAAGLGAAASLGAAICLDHHWLRGRILCLLAMAGGIAATLPYLMSRPQAALLLAVAVIIASHLLLVTPPVGQEHVPEANVRRRQRAKRAALTTLAMAIVAAAVDPAHHVLADGALAAAVLATQLLALRWVTAAADLGHRPMAHLLMIGIGATAAIIGLAFGQIRIAAFLVGGMTALLASTPATARNIQAPWWESLLDHPERILLTTFLALCLAGTLLLRLPGAMRLAETSLLDTAFTSVSAVCVTGLIVFDTPRDFTPAGQALILLLIQLGGLGIMSITTMALHATGRRMSLRQERLMTAMTSSPHQDLATALRTIFRFTLAAEGLGAIVLAALFLQAGDAPGTAAWRGLFTAVSAFCNAGFALQSDSLIGYGDKPPILHAVALLIILGGLAPAICLLIPRWLARHPVPLGARLALGTSAILLLGGSTLFLALEWHASLADLTPTAKLHHAWFQSVTARTAGFNSVDIAGITGPTALVMAALMFIGGSPGGTAGGIKTTTVAILAMAFWTGVAGRPEIVAHHRRIPPRTVLRAVTVAGAGLIAWLAAVLTLTITQDMPMRDLVFEATSALGTVGLSTGATARLDGIGKVIVILAMFIGRIGPVSLFMILSKDRTTAAPRHPDAHITLT